MQTPTKNANDMLDCLESEIDEAIDSILGGHPPELSQRMSTEIRSIIKGHRDSLDERMER
jgi:hypothetical protein